MHVKVNYFIIGPTFRCRYCTSAFCLLLLFVLCRQPVTSCTASENMPRGKSSGNLYTWSCVAWLACLRVVHVTWWTFPPPPSSSASWRFSVNNSSYAVIRGLHAGTGKWPRVSFCSGRSIHYAVRRSWASIRCLLLVYIAADFRSSSCLMPGGVS